MKLQNGEIANGEIEWRKDRGIASTRYHYESLVARSSLTLSLFGISQFKFCHFAISQFRHFHNQMGSR